MTLKNTDINYALVEENRPPLYTAMKYWGKKPHNIWHKYIDNYTPTNGIYLDPFAGSAMSAFEGYKSKKKVIALDINPLTSFVIETFSNGFDSTKFNNAANQIIKRIEKSEIYSQLFVYKKAYKDYVVHNIKWDQEKIYEVCLQSYDGKDRICIEPTKDDYQTIIDFEQYEISNPYPTKSFRDSSSFTKSFRENIGNNFSCLYTKRNLWVLSEIFKNIMEINDDVLKKQLLYAFIQTVHLSTKMCVPRSKKTKRDFSTSWGRSAYLYSKKQMEMNPLLLFQSSCFGKQSAGKALEYATNYFEKKPRIADVNKVEFSIDKNVDIWYGTVDIKTINTLFPKKSVDFVLTDPPYGGLIQYLDLSSIWLSWLELYDVKYAPDYSREITVNKNNSYMDFKKSLTEGLKNIRELLKDEGKLILTFNNSNLQIWGSFLSSITDAGFEIEKVIHQQNKRTGESNVSDPYGTSATDFYIRCIKAKNSEIKTLENSEIEDIIIRKIVEIIDERKEPTPYQILFNGLLAKLSTLKIDISSFDMDIKNVMKNHLGNELTLYKTAINKAGNFWWINNRKFVFNSPDTLTNRLERFINDLFENKKHYMTNEILQLVFEKFPNGLTPDVEIVFSVLKKHAIYIKRNWIRREVDEEQ